jgi:hypothetical protein
LELEGDEAISIYMKHVEKETEGRVWDHWLAIRPNMTDKTFVPYNEFLNRHGIIAFEEQKKKMDSKRTKEDILAKAQRINAAHLQQKGG